MTDGAGTTFANNIITGNSTGVQLNSSNNATFSGDIFTGNMLGIDLNNSTGTRVQQVSLTQPVGGTGLKIRNGSAGTVVRNTIFTDGLAAIVIDGPGSSMQFESNNSYFAGMDYYFILQNSAMSGATLDASQQFFNNVRATDFTIAQFVDAEDRTIDHDDFASLGNVFYKEITDLAALEEFRRNRNNLYRTSLFSYAGRTLANNIEQTRFSFQVNQINLSLLNQPSNPLSATASIANRFANLAPAAGGKRDAASFASMAPAAGGNATVMASISPATGVAAVAPGCGNSFLGSGFEAGFNAGTCSAQ